MGLHDVLFIKNMLRKMNFFRKKNQVFWELNTKSKNKNDITKIYKNEHTQSSVIWFYKKTYVKYFLNCAQYYKTSPFEPPHIQ